jgi:hypothetical protein
MRPKIFVNILKNILTISWKSLYIYNFIGGKPQRSLQMKKNKKGNKMFLLAMLAVTLVFGLVLAGCATDESGGGGPYDGPKSIKITGITGIGTEADVRVLTSTNGSNPSTLVARINVPVMNGVLTANLKMTDGDWDPIEKSWTGSGEYYIRLELMAGEVVDHRPSYSKMYFWAKDGEIAKYNIQDALTTLEFSQFKEVTLVGGVPVE